MSIGSTLQIGDVKRRSGFAQSLWANSGVIPQIGSRCMQIHSISLLTNHFIFDALDYKLLTASLNKQ
jgi:hypothetical protein